MQPGMVEPAAVQLAAVLAQGRGADKRAEQTRPTSDAPPKLQVSLAETHFSPVKPDAELQAYDLERRMGGDEAKDAGRSPRGGARTASEIRAERNQAAAQTQTDVRAEQLAQNVVRPASGDVAGQIGSRILQELEQARPAAEAREAGTVHVKQSDAALKVLEIKLEPRELGTVIVRMSLRNDVLNVELGFGKQDAAEAIAKSTDQLTSYLRSSGYDVDAIVVRVVDTDHRAHAPAVSSVTGGDGGQGQAAPGSSSSSAAGQSFGEQGERQPASRDGQHTRQDSGEGPNAQDNRHPRTGELFV